MSASNRLCCVVLLACLAPLTASAASPQPLTMIVMDPLAAPLSCPCVQGYAQRDYDKLAKFLEQELDRPVKVVYNESLGKALEDEAAGQADIVVGKRSVVVARAKRLGLSLQPRLALSGKDGQTTQTGLVVVPAGDPAKSVADLSGYRLIFGPADCDEKHGAALALLKKHGVAAPREIETCSACSDGATAILEAGAASRAATVVSSYAAPLLEGCGTIKKGDLRVIGTTGPVPFVTVFVNERLSSSEQAAVEQALREANDEPLLLIALESKVGFVPIKAEQVAEQSADASKKKN